MPVKAAILCFMFCLVSLLSVLTYASVDTAVIDNLAWTLRKDANKVEVYTADVDGSKFKAILSITTVNAEPERIVQYMRNPATCTQWVHRCQRSHLHHQISAQEDYVYTATTMPFMAKDRDILARLTWMQDPKTNRVQVLGKAVSGVYPKKNNYIRVEDATMIWEITPLDNGMSQIRNYSHVNPRGGLPAWLVNRLSTAVPFKTMLSLRKAFP